MDVLANSWSPSPDVRAGRRTRVVIAEDSELVMREVERLLAPDFDVVGKAADGISLVEETRRLQPDLVVTDLEMPGLSGIEASRAAMELHPDLPIVLLTAHNDPGLAEAALNAGIRGYVLKLTAAEELIAAAQSALNGEIFISEQVRFRKIR